MAKWLKKAYKRHFENLSGNMNISRGKLHEYLVTTLDFSAPGKVKTIMITFIEKW